MGSGKVLRVIDATFERGIVMDGWYREAIVGLGMRHRGPDLRP